VLERGAGVVLRNFREIDEAVKKLLNRLDEYRAQVSKIENRAVFEIPDILNEILERARPD
jgi:repressor of nif and glnA expression